MSFLRSSLPFWLVGMTVCLLYLFVFPQASFAATNFTTDYAVTYKISENGSTHAQLKGTLTNTTTQYYASSYKMQLGFDEMTNIQASDPDGFIKPIVSKNDTGYSIDLRFNKKAVGNGSKLPFTLSFDTPTIAKQYGKIWEINIPGIANPDDFTSFSVQVIVPSAFGKPAYIKPNVPNNNLLFTKDQLGKSGISIAFGESQLYQFNLTYHLKNDKVYPVRTEIALPPTTNYQNISVTQMKPEPLNVTMDSDGNWLADYRLLPSQKLDIVVEGVAQVNLIPKEQVLPIEEFALYTKEQPYWQTSSLEIKELANELKTPEAIYAYVVKTLHYDFSRVTEDKPRLGAVSTLKNQDSAVCREFTDLFIAISRAAGIPAREVNGFAYTENTKQRPIALARDILHAWPEYYDKDKKTWVMVDPTWGSTTGGVDYFSILDFDHLTFAIKGKDSEYPIPAGGYKFVEQKEIKDVSVAFADAIPTSATPATLTTDFTKVAIAGLPLVGTITLKNTGSSEITSQLLNVTSQQLLPSDQVFNTKTIPPFGSQSWKVGFRPVHFLTDQDEDFVIHFNPTSSLAAVKATHGIKIKPFYLTMWGVGGITLAGLGILLIIIIVKIRRAKLV